MVRMNALDACKKLYETGDALILSKMEMFTSRFLQRHMEMTSDVHGDVQVCAIELMTVLLKLSKLGKSQGK